MGVPKFFRYISERYPLISQLVADNRVSEFDNLYLDMNGIIHNCTHNDDDPTMVLTEEQMFTGIMRYIDQLFEVIQPRKIFYMAVDGVAPRAKMNQQRTRRFKSKREAEEKALQINNSKGRGAQHNQPGTIVADNSFDSNCITPGTEMMARLSAHLKYYIALRIKEDVRWRSIKIIFSGYEAPGEGEHKIMSFIRSQRSKPDWDPNTRHCLYGLDADLIMLGLLSHETHFALLREEVTFGPKKKAAKGQTRFYLLHLSLLREFLDLEFGSVKTELTFAYDVERIIDDFVLIAYFVGNDFLPSLPSLYIPNGSLAVMFQIYKQVLPKLDGYLNDRGIVQVKRVEVFLRELAENEKTVFDTEMADKAWLRNRVFTDARLEQQQQQMQQQQLVLTATQKVIFEQIKRFFVHFSPAELSPELAAFKKRNFDKDMLDSLRFPPTLSNKDRAFVTQVAVELCLNCEQVGSGRDRFTEIWQDEIENLAMYKPQNYFAETIAKYDNAPIRNDDFLPVDDKSKEQYDAAFAEWKKAYYRNKFKINYDTPGAVNAVRNSYIEGLQWVLHYYYTGVASWSWFFPYHYAPMISDLVDLHEVPIHFELGQPFRPFEQLLAVLPPQSYKLVPPALRPLMVSSDSVISDFYPHAFETDLNGKKNEWEAVVLIPFINQARLLEAMQPYYTNLTEEEKIRNSFGKELLFYFDAKKDFTYPSPTLGALFPNVVHCPVTAEIFVNPDVPHDKGFRQGRLPGAITGVDALAGFPSLYTLKFKSELAMYGVVIFDQQSRSESHVLTLLTPPSTADAVAQKFVDRKCYVGWPFLIEAIVVRVTNQLFSYQKHHNPSTSGKKEKFSIERVEHPNDQAVQAWERQAEQTEVDFSKRGIFTGPIDILVHVKPLKGLKRLPDGKVVKEYDHVEHVVPACAVVDHVTNEDKRFTERLAPSLDEELPITSSVLYLSQPSYGSFATIEGVDNVKEQVSISLSSESHSIDVLSQAIPVEHKEENYFDAAKIASSLGINVDALFRLTGSIMVMPSDGSNGVNLGFNLKFHHKGLRVVGYSRFVNKMWQFSQATIDLLQEYRQKFPELYKALTTTSAENNQFLERDLFSSNLPKEKSMRSVASWIKSFGIHELKHSSVSATGYSASEVAALTAEVDRRIAAAASTAAADAAKPVKMITGVDPSLLLTPELSLFRLGNQSFSLGDRVRICTWVAIGFGSWGTVIGIDKPKIQVLLDVATSHGTTLDGLCIVGRGAEVDDFGLLNMSRPVAPIGAPALASQPKTGAKQTPKKESQTPKKENTAAPNSPSKKSASATPAPLTASFAAMASPAKTPKKQQQQQQQQQQQHATNTDIGMPVIVAPRTPDFVPSFLTLGTGTPLPAPAAAPTVQSHPVTSIPLAELQKVIGSPEKKQAQPAKTPVKVLARPLLPPPVTAPTTNGGNNVLAALIGPDVNGGGPKPAPVQPAAEVKVRPVPVPRPVLPLPTPAPGISFIGGVRPPPPAQYQPYPPMAMPIPPMMPYGYGPYGPLPPQPGQYYPPMMMMPPPPQQPYPLMYAPPAGPAKPQGSSPFVPLQVQIKDKKQPQQQPVLPAPAVAPQVVEPVAAAATAASQ